MGNEEYQEVECRRKHSVLGQEATAYVTPITKALGLSMRSYFLRHQKALCLGESEFQALWPG